MPLPRTARSTSSERTLLLVCRLAVKVHLYRADDVLDLVRLSVCLSRAYDLLKIGISYRNFEFIGRLVQDAGN